MADGFSLLKPLLHALPPETVHQLGLRALRLGLFAWPWPVSYPSLKITALGLEFANPVGLAAGFDKNAVAIDSLLAQGFGFVEAGTVTPLAQPGNPKPRIFRLREDEAVINRLGFNNQGLTRFTENFQRRKRGIAGANIGKNKDSSNAIADYIDGFKAVYPYADYVTVNISSPNTPGLRGLQAREALEPLLVTLVQARGESQRVHGRRMPLLLKVAPDLEDKEKEDIAELVLTHSIEGMIVSNTTVARPESLKNTHAKEEGGLSGRPLFAPSTEVLKQFYRLTNGKIVLVGAGGIFSAEDAYAKIRAGATLLQLYTALVYRGFGMVNDIKTGLTELLKKDGFNHISQAVGKDAR